VSADLTSLNASAACQITSQVKPLPVPQIPLAGWKPPPAKPPLPPAIVLYEGPLDNLQIMKSSVDVADFQRELSIRQVERNVDELEQSRRVDEERARLEKERRKALDAQRAAAIAAERAKKQPEKLPPVIPESAGTANGGSSDAAPSPPDMVAPDPQAAPSPPVIVPQADQQDDDKSVNAIDADSAQAPKITVEPIPPPAGEAAQDAEAQTQSDAGAPAQGKSQPVAATRPVQRARERRRTSSDEVLRSLGNIP
jgi:hypothetical protein